MILRKILNKRVIVMDIRDCFSSDTQTVAASQALGKISAEIKYECPLAVPILLFGERISEHHVQLLMDQNIRVIAEH